MNRFKQELRQYCQKIRSQLPYDYQQNASIKVCNQLRALSQYRYAKHIALYQATNGEISVDSIWNSAPLQGKYCYFPVLNDDKTLCFLPATPATPFTKNRYGIAEPNVDKTTAIPPQEFDIIFVPLVAFDAYCTRLGMGVGYYDRTLLNVHHPLLIGIAYEFQKQPYIQPDTWDIPLTAVVTPDTLYWRE